MRAGVEVNRSRSSNRWALQLVVLGVFVGLGLLMTYPLIRFLGSRILGTPAPGDNFEYLYKTWWFKHALLDLGVSPFFNGDMFYPFGYNVALSETTLSNIIPALPLTVLLGEVAAYNLTLLGSFVLSGWGMYALVCHLTLSRLAGLIGGVIYAFCPYRMAHLGAGHLPLMGTQWLPLLILYLDRMIVRRRKSDALMAALFYGLGALSSWYYAYMFAQAGLVYVLIRGRPWRQHLWRRDFALCVLLFSIAGLLIVGPFVVPVTQLWEQGSRPQSLRYLDHFSASPLDFGYPNVMHPLWGVRLLDVYPQSIERILYLGWITLALAAVALWRQRDESCTPFLWLSVVFAVMSLGTTLHWLNAPVYVSVPAWLERFFSTAMGFVTGRLALFPISSHSLRMEGAVYLPLPTLLLYLFMPFFSAMRVWSRFGLVTVFGASVLASYGFQRLVSVFAQRRPRLRGPVWRRAGMRSQQELVLAGAILALILLDTAVFPFALGWCEVRARPVDEWLAGQPGDFAVMELPLGTAISGRTLYAMRTHGKKIGLGYGTFFPRAFDEQRGALDSFPSEESIALLKRWEIRYVLVRSQSYGELWPRLEEDLGVRAELRYVLNLEDTPIYEGDRVMRALPGTESAYVVDRIYVYEVL